MSVKIFYCAFIILALSITTQCSAIEAIITDKVDKSISVDFDFLNITGEEKSGRIKKFLANWTNFFDDENIDMKKIKPSSDRRKDSDFSDRCRLRKEVGTGNERKERFYYDINEKRCRCFYYSGKGGNANRFRTAEQCVAICPSDWRSINCSRN